ncbi:MAG: hypothetical protein JO142_13750 [Burkholderiales bacterium]|nr:hypothetical protein [Burkholderiales bacterium]
MSQTMTAPLPMRRALHTAPGLLRLRQGIIALLALVLALTAYNGYAFLNHVAQTIGHDAVPSIVAAEEIRTTLGYAHTELANAFLTNEGKNGPAMRAYTSAMQQAHDSLLTAAQNITYGDEERKPILALMTLLAEYERLVGAASMVGHYGDAMVQADVLMRTRILPAASALDQANFSHLDAAYRQFGAEARVRQLLVIGLALLLSLALIETQWHLYRHYRRVFNPSLLAGTLVLVALIGSYLNMNGAAMSSIRSAKEDAFDSVHALTRARSVAYDANALETLYLLENLHPDNQTKLTAQFNAAAHAIWHGSVSAEGNLPADLSVLKGEGMLGDELANITFEGEAAAATRTLNGWRNYVAIDARIRKLESEGHHAEAVALCIGTREGESDWAFGQFNDALSDTLKINQTAFDQDSERAITVVDRMRYLALAMLLVPLLAGFWGLRRRIAEFRA